MNEEQTRQIRKKLLYGVPPLTIQESRDLWHELTGERIVDRRRCEKCNGEGAYPPIMKSWGQGLCPDCNGAGYVSTEEEGCCENGVQDRRSNCERRRVPV